MRRRKLKTIKKLSKFKLPIFGTYSKKRFFLLSIFSFILVAYACLLVLQSPTSGKVLGEKLASCAGEPTCTTLPGGGEFRGNKNALQRYLNSRKGSYSPGEGAAQPDYGKPPANVPPSAEVPSGGAYSPGENASPSIDVVNTKDLIITNPTTGKSIRNPDYKFSWPDLGIKLPDIPARIVHPIEPPFKGPGGVTGNPLTTGGNNFPQIPQSIGKDLGSSIWETFVTMGENASQNPPVVSNKIVFPFAEPAGKVWGELKSMWSNPTCEGIDCTKSIFDPIKGGL